MKRLVKKLSIVGALIIAISLSVNTTHVNAAKVPKKIEITIRMVGDCLIHSPLYNAAKYEDGTYNFSPMFDNIMNDISSADLAIINQETIFVNSARNISSYPRFGSPTAVGDAEVKAGFDIIACATNHTADKGITGIQNTLDFWKKYSDKVTILGIHESAEESDIAYVEKNNIKIAFVNYTYGLNGLDSLLGEQAYMVDKLTDEGIEETLAEAEENADITIAILHVGDEYVYKPTKYEKEQVDRFIDNGADIVLCSHPHVLEPYEMHKTKAGNTGLVYYSLGNFISNQNTIDRILGGMAEITISKTLKKGASGENIGDYDIKIESYDLIPLVTHQQSGYYSTYRLDEYSDGMCQMHKLYKKEGLSIEKFKSLYESIVGESKESGNK